MCDMDRYEVKVSRQGIDMDLHGEDMEPSLTMWGLLYSAKHPWDLKTHIELSKGNIMKTNESQRVSLLQ